MRIIKADVIGMCFGVRDALAVIDGLSRPQDITIHGELVHNEHILSRLKERGFKQADEKHRRTLPLTESVLITAHGVSEAERVRLKTAGKQLVDTTCPLVRRAHDAARELEAAGFHVLVIGQRGHVEIEGIIGDLKSFEVVQSPAEVKNYPHGRLGIMSQTTTPEALAKQIHWEVVSKNATAEVCYIDTICHPTKQHQAALERLLDQVDVMVVVGGRNSNNTRALVARSLERGVRAYHVQAAADLQPAWFDGKETVGLTAGTSTLDQTIDEVYQALSLQAYRGLTASACRVPAGISQPMFDR